MEEKVSSRPMDVKPNATYGEIRSDLTKEMRWEELRSEKYWEYRKNWEEYPKAGITPDFPLCINIETTNVCNLDCIMCPRTVLIARGTFAPIGLMNFDLYRKIIDEGEKYNLPSVKLQYLGEPLVHRDLAKQIRYAKDAGVLDVMFNTNATLLTEEKSHEILEAGIDAIFFPFDSMDPDTYNKIRLGASFDKVVENIVRFIEIKNAKGYDHVHTRTSLTVIEHDIDDLEKFKEFWLDYVDAVGFGIYHDLNEDGCLDSPYVPEFVCAQPFQRLFIMWDGVATPCCTDENRYYKMGDVNKESVHSVWHGPKARALRDAHLDRKYKEIDICAKCYFPHTELDGQVISFQDVGAEVRDLAERQRSRWISDNNPELSKKARARSKKRQSNAKRT